MRLFRGSCSLRMRNLFDIRFRHPTASNNLRCAGYKIAIEARITAAPPIITAVLVCTQSRAGRTEEGTSFRVYHDPHMAGPHNQITGLRVADATKLRNSGKYLERSCVRINQPGSAQNLMDQMRTIQPLIRGRMLQRKFDERLAFRMTEQPHVRLLDCGRVSFSLCASRNVANRQNSDQQRCFYVT